MTLVRLTTQQRRAVEAPERTVFVSAGAGSGKTSVLVERYLRLVLNHGATPREVAAVTFTRKAAGELRQRIRSRLLEEGRRQAAEEIDQAPIGTIHSLCVQILRARGLVRGHQPDFRILDESEAAILLDDAFQRAWERVASAASDEEMEILARHEDRLREAVPAAFRALRGSGHRHPNLRFPPPRSLDDARAALETALDRIDEQVVGCTLGSKTSQQNYQKASLCRDWLSSCEPGLPSVQAAARLVPHMRGNEAKRLFSDMKEALLDMCRALGERYVAGAGAVADRLIRELDGAYADLKTARNALDFVDLEIEALESLADGDGDMERLHLLIDEFQDTNDLQCRLFDALQPLSLMSVGDYFQSIYGFRNADCEVFRARRDALWGDDNPPETLSEVWASTPRSRCYVPLCTSFRASEALLTVLNRLFGSEVFFGRQYEPLASCPAREVAEDYAAARRDPVCELHIVGLTSEGVTEMREEGDEDEVVADVAEPAVVAERVRRLIDDEGWSARHIAILLRKISHAHLYVAELEARGIGTYLVGGRGYFSTDEIADLTALLTLLVDPHSDLHLVTVLRSPMVALTDDGLAQLGYARHRGRWPSLWDALKALQRGTCDYPNPLSSADQVRAGRLVQAVANLGRRVGAPGLSSLIDETMQALDLDVLSLALAGGRRRYANVRKLMRLADSFEAVEGPDLAAFLRYISRRGRLDDREGEATVLAEEEDVVRVMTVHQAKGLEFPVVVFAGLGELPGGSAPALLAAGDGTVALRLSLPGSFSALGGRVSLGPYEDLMDAVRARGSQEEARICYVAATRARERLILVGSRRRRMSRLSERPLLWFAAAAGLSEDDAMTRSFHGERLPGLGLEVTTHEGAYPEPPAPSADADGAGAPVASRAGTRRVTPPAFPQPTNPRPRITSVSFSALSLYESCPRRYYLERVLGVPAAVGLAEALVTGADDAPVEIGMSTAAGLANAVPDDEGPLTPDRADRSGGDGAGAIRRGLVVHRMLELADLEGPAPSPEALTALYEQVEATVEAERVEGERQRCVELVSAFWRSPVAGLDLRGARRELPFAFGVDGIVVNGVMDLVVARAEQWLVVDYKTNRLPEGDPSAVMPHYARQAALYGLAALKGGADAVAVDFLFLEAPERPVHITYDRDDAAGLESDLSDALSGLIAGEFPREGAHCHLCPQRAMCVCGDT